MIQATAWHYGFDRDITDRGLSFREFPIRAGNLYPRGLRAAIYEDRTPVFPPSGVSRWHCEAEYTQEMKKEDLFYDFFKYPEE